MDLERAIEFILQQNAKTDAALQRLTEAQVTSAAQQAQTDRRLDRLDRNVARLARLGLRARNNLKQRADEHQRRLDDHQRRLDAHEKWLNDQQSLMHEIGEKLNALIDVVDRWPRNPS